MATSGVSGISKKRGGRLPQKGCQPIIWHHFCWKLREIEINLTERGPASLTPPPIRHWQLQEQYKNNDTSTLF